MNYRCIFVFILISCCNTFFGQGVDLDGDGGGPLPVKITSFNAIKSSDFTVLLNWKTVSEINSSYFGIERSLDGVIWKNVDKVTAKENSNSEINYQYLDKSLTKFEGQEQIYYYRLKITDLDESYKYSKIVSVSFNNVSEEAINIFPNPANEFINIEFLKPEPTKEQPELFIYDIAGKILVHKFILEKELNYLSVNHLPLGTYNLSIKQAENIYYKRFLKVK